LSSSWMVELLLELLLLEPPAPAMPPPPPPPLPPPDAPLADAFEVFEDELLLDVEPFWDDVWLVPAALVDVVLCPDWVVLRADCEACAAAAWLMADWTGEMEVTMASKGVGDTCVSSAAMLS
jgi:hypothetical protein